MIYFQDNKADIVVKREKATKVEIRYAARETLFIQIRLKIILKQPFPLAVYIYLVS